MKEWFEVYHLRSEKADVFASRREVEFPADYRHVAYVHGRTLAEAIAATQHDWSKRHDVVCIGQSRPTGPGDVIRDSHGNVYAIDPRGPYPVFTRAEEREFRSDRQL